MKNILTRGIQKKNYLPNVINKLWLGLIAFHNSYPQFDNEELGSCLSLLRQIENRITYGNKIQWEKTISEMIKVSPKKTITFNQLFPTGNDKVYKEKILEVK